MKYLLKYRELKVEVYDWKSIDLILKDIKTDFETDKTWDNFMNIDPSEIDNKYGSSFGLETTIKAKAVMILIVDLFNERSEKLIKALLKYELWIENAPDDDELIIHTVEDLFKYISESDKKIITKIIPEKVKKIEMNIELNNFGI